MEVVKVEPVMLKEGQEYSLTGVYITDVNSGERPPSLVVELDAQHGSFISYDYTAQQFLSSQITNNNLFPMNSMKLYGTPDEVNGMLVLILYRPDAYYNGNDGVSIRACDLDVTAVGIVPLCSVQVLPLIITPVNDPPIWVFPSMPIVIIEGKICTLILTYMFVFMHRNKNKIVYVYEYINT